jgi:hypothetical protein
MRPRFNHGKNMTIKEIVINRCPGYLETGEAEVYKDGDLYIVNWLMSAELHRAAALYG